MFIELGNDIAAAINLMNSTAGLRLLRRRLWVIVRELVIG
jgi:hypothetical protein